MVAILRWLAAVILILSIVGGFGVMDQFNWLIASVVWAQGVMFALFTLAASQALAYLKAMSENTELLVNRFYQNESDANRSFVDKLDGFKMNS